MRKAHDRRMRIALLYPNSYAVGMSNLGFQTLYRLLNARDDVVCERAFLPDTISDTTRLRTLESDTLLADMDVVAFSISYELDYPNVPRMLRLGGIEPWQAQRRGPLVLAGGATVCYNPEPIAHFLDLAFIGEAEASIDTLYTALDTLLHGGALADMAGDVGLYQPSRGTAPVARIHVAERAASCHGRVWSRCMITGRAPMKRWPDCWEIFRPTWLASLRLA